MNNSKRIFSIFLIFQFCLYSICFSEDYTQKMINIGKKRASADGNNLIACSKDSKGVRIEHGNVSWGANGIIFSENDMVLNVGNVPLKLRGFDLKPGEFLVMTNGSFKKSKDTLKIK